MKCKNCDNKVDGNFCANCGQNSKVDKLNLPNFITEISDSVFQLNRGLFFTIKELFTRPGHAIRDFIQGKRKEYFKPIAFVLTLSTIYFLVSQISDSPTLIDDFLNGASDGASDTEKGKDSITKFPIVNWLSNNYAYTTLLLIPIFSLASFISFLGLGKNYLENIVINSYITGQQAIFYSLFMVIGAFFDINDYTVLPAVIISVLFNFWSYIQFFSNTKKGLVIIRLFLTYFIFNVLFFILIMAITIPFLNN
ncbi:DUF3667 domain-containing protein [Flavobacteriaceae bacterium TP-CH-4]|uniref:DUF3667 domain-containing protein n=1 Tax=Pelagihabitans pacificus TaxID=2696054 RepID=A0A967ECX4_9FLAO|nr:DUF3667 domain-containing protein [Pelagihabitans pacificus]NHF61621.1 DUF3667 domain-containing protein [Pelagihabitans pacificus]